MNISQEVREKIQLLSPGERISHYLAMLTEKKITKAQYDAILEVVLRLPYTQIVTQGSEIRGNIGEQRENDIRSEPVSDSGLCDTEHAPEQNTDTPSVECSSEEFISELSDVSTVSGHSTAKDNTSQKQRLLTLLSDYEWHTTPQIQVAVYGANHLGIARVAARVNDLKQDGYDIESRKVTQSIWQYRLVEKGMRWITENIASG